MVEFQSSKLTMWVQFPSSAFLSKYRQMFQGGELVSKTDCGGFDSLLPMPKNGDLAQLVEQTAVNRRIVGSSPAIAAIGE